MCEEVMRMIDDGCPNVSSADEQAYSEEMHRQNDPHYISDSDRSLPVMRWRSLRGATRLLRVVWRQPIFVG